VNTVNVLLGLCGRSAVSPVTESTSWRDQRGSIHCTSGRRAAEI